MNNPDTPLILKALEQLPHYASSMSHGFEFERLGGLTNRVYKVQPESLAPVVGSSGRGRGGAVERAGRAFLKTLSGKPIEPPEGYHDIVRQAEHLKQALSVRPVTLARVICSGRSAA